MPVESHLVLTNTGDRRQFTAALSDGSFDKMSAEDMAKMWHKVEKELYNLMNDTFMRWRLTKDYEVVAKAIAAV